VNRAASPAREIIRWNSGRNQKKHCLVQIDEPRAEFFHHRLHALISSSRTQGSRERFAVSGMPQHQPSDISRSVIRYAFAGVEISGMRSKFAVILCASRVRWRACVPPICIRDVHVHMCPGSSRQLDGIDVLMHVPIAAAMHTRECILFKGKGQRRRLCFPFDVRAAYRNDRCVTGLDIVRDLG